LYAFLVVLLGWVLFRSPDITTALRYLAVMAGGGVDGLGLFAAELIRDARFKVELAAAVLLAMPVYPALRSLLARGVAAAGTGSAATAAALAQGALRLFLFASVVYFAVISIAARAYHPFLYFQF
jgi:alginate O-acetyltransferase complex protein AlgI